VDRKWPKGKAPVAVIMISLNEGHNLEAALLNIHGWASEVFLLDSYSKDCTVDIALKYGVSVMQRRFRGFGDQWNYALENFPIKSPWTMKLDPDERLSDQLKEELILSFKKKKGEAFEIKRRLWFMERPLPVSQTILRVWKTGKCRFTDISVNEHPIVDGKIEFVAGDLEHFDSPNMEHWINKQNRYSTVEANIRFTKSLLAVEPRLLGTRLEQIMWLKQHFFRIPFRYFLLFIYYFVWKGTWKSGRVGFIWARLRADHMRMIEYKEMEMRLTGKSFEQIVFGLGRHDSRVEQVD
jgi:glycosyltransferase involved in cell wall biosynthesis